MKITLSDVYDTEVKISESNSGYVRLDFVNERAFPEKIHNGEKVPNCISFTVSNAKLIYSFLGAMLQEIEERDE